MSLPVLPIEIDTECEWLPALFVLVVVGKLPLVVDDVYWGLPADGFEF